MPKNNIYMTKIRKGESTFTNFYLFGVAVNPVKKKDFTKLYYQVKGYCEGNNIDIPYRTINDVAEEKKESNNK